MSAPYVAERLATLIRTLDTGDPTEADEMRPADPRQAETEYREAKRRCQEMQRDYNEEELRAINKLIPPEKLIRGSQMMTLIDAYIMARRDDQMRTEAFLNSGRSSRQAASRT